MELWGPILGAKIVHFGSLGGPWHLEKPNPEKKPQKSSKRGPPVIELPTFWRSCFIDFLVDFSVRFLDYFWSHFGDILGAKMEPTSMKNRFKIRSKFLSDFWVVPGTFLVD